MRPPFDGEGYKFDPYHSTISGNAWKDTLKTCAKAGFVLQSFTVWYILKKQWLCTNNLCSPVWRFNLKRLWCKFFTSITIFVSFCFVKVKAKLRRNDAAAFDENRSFAERRCCGFVENFQRKTGRVFWPSWDRYGAVYVVCLTFVQSRFCGRNHLV